MKTYIKLIVIGLLVLGVASPAFALVEKKVKVSTNDNTAGFLNGKLVAGTNISFVEGNDGGNEILTISTTGSAGEINTASNQGVGGVGVFDTKNGVDLEHKNINAGSNKITITDDSGNKEIDIDVAEANLTLSSLGGAVTDAQVPDTITLTNFSQITNRLHASDHAENASDEILGENLGTACTINQIWKSDGSGGAICAADSTGGSPSFDTIASGTNTTAAMVMGTGASLATSGSGTITATTSVALAANGGNCTAGSYPLGVDDAGAVESCTDASTEIDSIVATHTAIATAHHTATVETNTLETTITGVLDTEVFVGTGADTGNFVVISADASLANTGALTVASVHSGTAHHAAEAAASTTTAGISEYATTAEMDTGTSTTLSLMVNEFNGSDWAIKYVQVLVTTDFDTDTAVADGGNFFHIPAGLDGYNIVEVHAEVITAGTTNTTDVQIANVTSAADILSTKLTIDSAETGSDTAATPAVINAAEDDVAENDLLRFDIDAVSTTAAKGLIVTVGFRKP